MLKAVKKYETGVHCIRNNMMDTSYFMPGEEKK